jgi:hypothetical protein
MTNKEYIEAAKREYYQEGKIEIDSNAVVSRGEDPGAWVQAWVFVENETEGEIASKYEEIGKGDDNPSLPTAEEFMKTISATAALLEFENKDHEDKGWRDEVLASCKALLKQARRIR